MLLLALPVGKPTNNRARAAQVAPLVTAYAVLESLTKPCIKTAVIQILEGLYNLADEADPPQRITPFNTCYGADGVWATAVDRYHIEAAEHAAISFSVDASHPAPIDDDGTDHHVLLDVTRHQAGRRVFAAGRAAKVRPFFEIYRTTYFPLRTRHDTVIAIMATNLAHYIDHFSSTLGARGRPTLDAAKKTCTVFGTR